MRVLPFVFLFAAACGSSAKPAEDAPAPTTAPSADPAPPAAPADDDKPSTSLPTACDSTQNGVCIPPQKFVKKLCSGNFPDVALAMFQKGTPWTRGYLTRNTDAWYASGGASSNDKLVFDEEVIVLTHRTADTGGMQVSGASGGGWDVMRWDGSCASLANEEFTQKPPPKPKNAKIPWRFLDDKIQAALLADDKVAKVNSERKKECKGATMGDVSLKCEKADALLSVVVADSVRNGTAIPTPSKLP